ncbi:hypothetical protein J6590_050181 [Homalodisca vitripennis]|nr:hypothetical protein J6590_050181 [Homalodisca vitripennis]
MPRYGCLCRPILRQVKQQPQATNAVACLVIYLPGPTTRRSLHRLRSFRNKSLEVFTMLMVLEEYIQNYTADVALYVQSYPDHESHFQKVFRSRVRKTGNVPPDDNKGNVSLGL